MKEAEILNNLISTDLKQNPNEITRTVEKIVNEKRLNEYSNDLWHNYLNKTGQPDFLSQIESPELRIKWAESVFKIIQHSEYSLKTMFDQRVKDIPEHVLFRDMSTAKASVWTYEQENRNIRQYAAVFHKTAKEKSRLAIFSANCIESATSDLACLLYDIYNCPLSTHLSTQILVNIFDAVNINIAVCETQERLDKLLEVRQKTKQYFFIYTLSKDVKIKEDSVEFIGNATTLLDAKEITTILDARKVKPINEVATTMFTSGSTGLPKGVSFSIYNLVSKRFARHAALPNVGRDEVLLCFLPLFHTFGRYLEMLGMIYWRGTYTFAGNTSADTLFSLFPKVNPSGFISVPVRWQQMYNQIQNSFEESKEDYNKVEIIKQTVGNRLKWGLSAAGYLSPKVFKFFEDNDINLCSGFGMTEATGGITMTPPGKYREKSTGIMLPGVYGRLIENGELQLSGHYIAHYFPNKAAGDIIEYPENLETDYWMNTGDIFTKSEDGYYEIIDRVKDIYKNNKGQTIAPKTVEQLFIDVPGIKQTFLVGDGRPYNVLLIAPDCQDEMLKEAVNNDGKLEYFHQIVMHANKDLAKYERVINFSILDREFSQDKGELTPKGSYNRKTIEKNFADLINKLYKTNSVRLEHNNINLVIPRWFYRDLGILENDIITTDKGLENRRTKSILGIKRIDDNKFLIGDLIYDSSIDTIDLGRIARQPRLWIGNPEFIGFSPVKEGWDLPLKKIKPQVYRQEIRKTYHPDEIPKLQDIRNEHVINVNELVCKSLFGIKEISLQATHELKQALKISEERLSDVIRHRLEALANDDVEEIRILAYRILLLDKTNPDIASIFPAFINSNKSFLTEESIKEIAQSNFEKRHLNSLRKRMYHYRTQLTWPATDNMLEQFKKILELLFHFASNNLSFYSSIRAELASWILHKQETRLAKLAEHYFFELYRIFDKAVKEKTPKYNLEDFKKRIVYENSISRNEIEKFNKLFKETLFLDQSIILAYDEWDFNLFSVAENGIWISRIMSFQNYHHYLLCINTQEGKHFKLHMVSSKLMRPEPNYEPLYWLSSLSGHPFGAQLLPVLGCSRTSYGVRTTKFLGEITTWVKIRELSEIDHLNVNYLELNAWRKLFIKSFSIFFKACSNSNFKIVPGIVSPNNITSPIMDFRDNASIITLSGMTEYKNTLSLLEPMVKEFYMKTFTHYPWVKSKLKLSWIFHAVYEAFDEIFAKEYLNQMEKDLGENDIICQGKKLSEELNEFITKSNQFHLPLSLFNAIDRYAEWEKRSPLADAEAKEHTIFELYELYKLCKYPDVVRYYFFMQTYFVNADENIKLVFDKLISKLRNDVSVLPTQLIELSDLQSIMMNTEDKNIFSKMVFPRKQNEQEIDILTIKIDKNEQIIIRSKLIDDYGNEYNFREPLEPSEIGKLYHIFYQVNYPKTISKMDKHFVVTNKNDKVIGGICYKELENGIVLIDGSAINTSLQGRGIGSAMVEDFLTRMASNGVKVVKAHFLLGNYYLKHNFKADKKWGALVKYLD